jgi:hypothetical protein
MLNGYKILTGKMIQIKKALKLPRNAMTLPTPGR